METTENSLKGRVPDMKPTPRKRSATGAEQRLKQAQHASTLLKHVSDPTRLLVILILSDGEQHVGSLCDRLSQSQPAVSHHLALLRHGGVIAPRRQGKNNFYGLTDKGEVLSRIVKSLLA
jgi:DNA-binding transcriptional ArsR family regulator